MPSINELTNDREQLLDMTDHMHISSSQASVFAVEPSRYRNPRNRSQSRSRSNHGASAQRSNNGNGNNKVCYYNKRFKAWTQNFERGCTFMGNERNVYSFFDLIIELRFGETIPATTYSRITSEVINQFLELFSDELSVSSQNLIKQIKRFSSRVYLQKVYLKSLGHLIEPIPITINTPDFELQYQYIPLKDIVNIILKNNSLVEEIIQEQTKEFTSPSNVGYLNELTCEYARWNRINGKLRIQLYSDEFCIVNPVGHSRSMHYYLVIYASFTNIPFKYRLKRDNISLVLIVNYRNITPSTTKLVLEKLNHDMNELVLNGIKMKLLNGNDVIITCVFLHF
ncbi:hypothetical protein RDWZM_001357 [Blomia tropicalis]|uniref:Uncharacterized protein n=1 Tax=Blomia tropicalis TaxID=40697 RepID=A0A9Q0MEF7_BLOTA|nr:hypothetical protein RDWZM_001357 [Blomia tropicalis]